MFVQHFSIAFYSHNFIFFLGQCKMKMETKAFILCDLVYAVWCIKTFSIGKCVSTLLQGLKWKLFIYIFDPNLLLKETEKMHSPQKKKKNHW